MMSDNDNKDKEPTHNVVDNDDGKEVIDFTEETGLNTTHPEIDNTKTAALDPDPQP